jgi:hypothetical protein
MTNFMLGDIGGAARASVGFSAILLAPGYLLAGALDLFGFRRRSMLERLACGISLSVAIAPILTILAGHIVPLGAIAIFFAATLAGMLGWLAAGHRQLHLPRDRHTVLLGIFLLIGSALVVGELIDIQRGARLYLSVTVLDQAYRVAFTNAIAHTGIPPLNPLYHPGVAAPLRYYYFWYALCAVCMELAHVSARQALIASSVWAGLGLVATIALFARHFLAIREGLHRYILAATLLLTVTGLDILPALYNLFANHDFRGDLEWWSIDQIASWLDSILWVPNHLGSMLSCMAAYLLLWRARGEATRRHRLAATLLAGAAIASAFGLSIYVAVGFGILVAAWSLSLLARERDLPAVLRNCAAAATAILLLIPFLRELLGAHSGTQGRAAATPARMFAFSIREMISADLITGLPAFAALRRAHPVALDQLARLVLLLPGYALELGFFGLVLGLAIRKRKRLDAPRKTALWLSLLGLVVVSLMRSSVIGNNDFGYRAALLPCFFLLLLAADRMTSLPAPRSAPLLYALLLVGLAGTAFQALMLRIFLPLLVSAKIPAFEHLPQQVYAARMEYTAIAKAVPERAIVQSNPINPGSYLYVANMLSTQNAMAANAGGDCGAVFGGDPSVCEETQAAIRKIFAAPAMPEAVVLSECRRLGIDYLLVTSTDPVWHDAKGWVWALPTLARTESGRGQAPGDSFRTVNCAGNERDKH